MSQVIKFFTLGLTTLLFAVFFVLIILVWAVGFILYTFALAINVAGEWLMDKLDDARFASRKLGNFWDKVLWSKLGLFQGKK